MKIFAFLFSIYLIALILVPCSDTYNEWQNDQQKVSVSESHDHQNDHSDFCSPFCTCSCCSTSADMKYSFHTFKEVKTSIVSNVKFPLRNLIIISNYFGNIWQPPQITA